MTHTGEGAVLGLHRATHATLHALGADLAGLGLSSSEINAMAVLADGRARSVGELAVETATGGHRRLPGPRTCPRPLATRPTTLTSVLDRLDRRGLVVRELDPGDRRSFTVRLTEAGREAAAEVDAAVRRLEREHLTGVSETELAGFRAVLLALTKAAR